MMYREIVSLKKPAIKKKNVTSLPLGSRKQSRSGRKSMNKSIKTKLQTRHKKKVSSGLKSHRSSKTLKKCFKKLELPKSQVHADEYKHGNSLVLSNSEDPNEDVYSPISPRIVVPEGIQSNLNARTLESDDEQSKRSKSTHSQRPGDKSGRGKNSSKKHSVTTRNVSHHSRTSRDH